EVDYIERVYIHGDGASWIEEGLNWLPKAKKVLDRYHLIKAMLAVASRQPETRVRLCSALYSGDQRATKQRIQQLKQDAKDDSEKKRILKFNSYIKRNWSGIAILSLPTLFDRRFLRLFDREGE